MVGHEDAEPHRDPGARRRGRPVGPDRAAVEALARVARPRLADRGPVRRWPRRCSRYVARPRPARRARAAHRRRRRDRLRRGDRAPERRHRAHERHARRARRRRRAGAGRADRRRARPVGLAPARPGAATRWRSPASRSSPARAAPAPTAGGDLLVLASVARLGRVHRRAAGAAARARRRPRSPPSSSPRARCSRSRSPSLMEGAPPLPAAARRSRRPLALALAGTLLPFWLFAYGAGPRPGRAGRRVRQPRAGRRRRRRLAAARARAPRSARSPGAAAVLIGIAVSTLPPRAPAAACA